MLETNRNQGLTDLVDATMTHLSYRSYEYELVNNFLCIDPDEQPIIHQHCPDADFFLLTISDPIYVSQTRYMCVRPDLCVSDAETCQTMYVMVLV